MKQFSFGKIRYLFLTYQKFVMPRFLKIFFGKYGIFVHAPQWPMDAYSNGNKRYVYNTELKLRLCIKSVYNVKSLALTLSFPQAFKDAATERRAPPHPQNILCDKTIGSRELIYGTIPIKKCMKNLEFFQPNLRWSSGSPLDMEIGRASWRE